MQIRVPLTDGRGSDFQSPWVYMSTTRRAGMPTETDSQSTLNDIYVYANVPMYPLPRQVIRAHSASNEMRAFFNTPITATMTEIFEKLLTQTQLHSQQNFIIGDPNESGQAELHPSLLDIIRKNQSSFFIFITGTNEQVISDWRKTIDKEAEGRFVILSKTSALKDILGVIADVLNKRLKNDVDIEFTFGDHGKKSPPTTPRASQEPSPHASQSLFASQKNTIQSDGLTLPPLASASSTLNFQV